MRLSTEQKNRELEKYFRLVQATFDYLTTKFGRKLVIDDVALDEVMYSNQKIIAEKQFNERRLDKLKKQLKVETNWLMFTLDLDFSDYIKKNTAYEFDLFEDIKNATEEVLKKGIIENETDSRNVGLMINLYEKTVPDPEKMSRLQALQKDFHDKKWKSMEMESKKSKKQYEEHSQTREWVEENGMMMEVISGTVTVWDGPKPKHYKERKETAPNGKLSFTLTEYTSGKQSSTDVSIDFPETRIQIYHAEGIHPDINAFWKDNNTICIETLKQYTTLPKYKKVESYGDIVFIEYTEN